MEGVKLTSQCKLCFLLKQNDDLWVETHKRVIEEELSYSIVCRWLNSKVETLNESLEKKLPKFNTSNFALHFKKHVSDINALHGCLKKHMYSGGKKGSTLFTDKQVAMAEAALYDSPKEAEYKRLAKMINKMEVMLNKYSEEIDEKKKPTRLDIESYNKFVADLIGAKQNLDKMRGYGKQASMAVHSAVEMVVKGMAEKAIGVADEVQEALELEMKDTLVPERIARLIKSRFSTDLRNIVYKVVETVRKEYGIK